MFRVQEEDNGSGHGLRRRLCSWGPEEPGDLRGQEVRTRAAWGIM